jgi:predicted Zn-dependent peptidase
VPAAVHADAPALAMLSAILTGGRTSRLYRRLVLDDRSATGVFSSMGPGTLFPQLFQIDATPRFPSTPVEVEEAIYQEIARVAEEGPTDEEVERVANQIAAGSVRRLQSNLGLAFQIADSESLLGDWTETFRVTERLQEVTAEDIRRVAAAYLRASNRTVATLAREPGE